MEQAAWKIELAQMGDVDELEKLYDDLNDHLEANNNYAGWAKGVYPKREDAEKGIAEKGLFVLRIGDKIAGSLILNHRQEAAYAEVTWGIEAEESEVMVLRTMATNPRFMKQGVSHRLLEFAREHALSQGAKTIRLDVTVQNEPAIALYEKCGYNYVGTVDLGLPYEHLKWFRLYELVL